MRQIDNLKFMAMALLVALFSLSFTACSDDDEEVTSSITDYYMSCEVSGGNLSSSERTQMEAYWNSIFIEVSKEAWAAYTLDEAVYAFDTTVKIIGICGVQVIRTTLHLIIIIISQGHCT